MTALIIALVVLVLVAIGVVVRLLIAELAKPAPGKGKATRKVVVPASALAGATAGAATVARPVRPGSPGPVAGAATARPAAHAGDHELASSLGIGATGTAVLDRPRPTSGPGRTRRARMRDVVERGEGVQITPWRRMRSGISLLVLVSVLGTSTAAVIGGFVLLIVLALDQAIN